MPCGHSHDPGRAADTLLPGQHKESRSRVTVNCRDATRGATRIIYPEKIRLGTDPRNGPDFCHSCSEGRPGASIPEREQPNLAFGLHDERPGPSAAFADATESKVSISQTKGPGGNSVIFLSASGLISSASWALATNGRQQINRAPKIREREFIGTSEISRRSVVTQWYAHA